ncbi:MAG: hypothetical protein LBV41_10830 [Cytophagaceae bacterium]|jgi:hypothetical protein|nr:hypothetical protein [Cytophagaceae bacterium]
MVVVAILFDENNKLFKHRRYYFCSKIMQVIPNMGEVKLGIAPSPLMVSTTASLLKFHVSSPVVPLLCAKKIVVADYIEMALYKNISTILFIAVSVKLTRSY